jgi:solute carrier family 25 carnitine/acylcarnitine transporter 20/29
MTHNEERGHWINEGLIGMGVGILYGVSNVAAGHPFDTIKTKMQAQPGFEKIGMFKAISKTVKAGGIKGLYRGCVPPLWGSGIFRSAQFAVFEGVYTAMDNHTLRQEIPGSSGLQLRVVMAAMCASTARAVIETPLEYAKVKRQTGQIWAVRGLYTGFGVTWARTMGLMTTYFILIDSQRRNFPNLFASPVIGPFLASGISATLAWWIVWPLEYMKSQVQSQFGQRMSTIQRMKLVLKEVGFFGLYRGLAPGSIRSFLANGTAMVVMATAQKKVTQWGLRNKKTD